MIEVLVHTHDNEPCPEPVLVEDDECVHGYKVATVWMHEPPC